VSVKPRISPTLAEEYFTTPIWLILAIVGLMASPHFLAAARSIDINCMVGVVGDSQEHPRSNGGGGGDLLQGVLHDVPVEVPSSQVLISGLHPDAAILYTKHGHNQGAR